MGQITVATNIVETDQQVEIVICDTGAGIEKSHLNKIYEPFFTTKPVGQGTGQGLSIARRIVVEKHKGVIDCRSKLGEGSTFVIRLPIKSQSEETAAVLENESFQMKKILFVDDEENVLAGLKNLLRRFRKEWDMQFATSGQQALDKMAESPFDIVVSDMRMPNMDGAQLLRTVKERYPEVIRIVLSGHTDPDTAVPDLAKIIEQDMA